MKYYANRRGKEAEDLVTTRMGRKLVLPVHIGNELVNYCLLMGRIFFGPTTKDIKKNGFSVSNNNLPHPFSKEKRENW
jgi:hypothetical protein